MTTRPTPSEIRFKVDPGDIPPEKAARRLHLTIEKFKDVLPRLMARGFPAPDPDTGNFGLDAIDQWRKLRTPGLFGLTPGRATEQAAVAPPVVGGLGDRFAATKRSRHG